MLFLVLACVAPLLAVRSYGQSLPEYKTIPSSQSRQPTYTIARSHTALTFRAADSNLSPVSLPVQDGLASRIARPQPLAPFDSAGVHIGSQFYSFDAIVDAEVATTDGHLSVALFSRADTTRRARIRQGNRIDPFTDISIDSGTFIRGVVMSVTGDIIVRGEVNKDVISLFGDVTIAPGGVVRGDVVSMYGLVTVDGRAVLYGRVADGSADSFHRRKRGTSAGVSLAFDGGFQYNRVDGFLPWGRASFGSVDSTIPEIQFQLGYAEASDRIRAQLDIRHVVLRSPVTEVSLSARQWLTSDDERLLGWDENSVFSLLATEDFMDYLERRGVSFGVRVQPMQRLRAELRFEAADLNWIEASPNLWSLAGGSKRFPLNFGRPSVQDRESAAAERDSSRLRELSVQIALSKRDDQSSSPKPSDWRSDLELLWSESSWSASRTYHRFHMGVERDQLISGSFRLRMAVRAGGGSSSIPVDRLWYLGGLSTLHGYDHKEFSGAYFWSSALEAQFSPGIALVTIAPLWEAAKLYQSSDDRGSQIYQDAGVSVYLSSLFRVIAARRLDRSTDNSVKFYCRFSVSF